MIEEAIKEAEPDRDALTSELGKLEALYRGKEDKEAWRTFIQVKGHQCASTPASDGERIFGLFAPGLLVCCDLDGKVLWTHAVVNEDGQPGKGGWGGTLAEVPLVADGKVVVACGDRIHCVDAATGRLRWQIAFPSGHNAATGVIGRVNETHYLCLPGGGGHGVQVRRLDDGKVVFQEHVDRRIDPLYAQRGISADRQTIHHVLFALRLNDDRAQPVSVLWQLPEENWLARKSEEHPNVSQQPVYGGSHQYCAPVVHGGIVYYLCTHSKKFLSALDAETGKVIYRPEIGVWGATYSDLTLAGEHLFVFNGHHEAKGHEGACLVLKAGRKYEKVGENTLERVVANNPVFEGRRMYMRTVRGLWCIEKPKAEK
jgi:outer membrane protein assembly factor BamB